MADDYHIIGGMVAFIIVVLAIIGSASLEYPEVAGAATAPSGGQWPPSFPVFGEFTTDPGPAPECIIAVLCLNILGWFLIAAFLWFINVIFYLAAIVGYLIQLFFGLVAFAVSGLPAEIAWIGIGIGILFAIIFILIFIRLIISAIPFSGGGS
jgi:hypothetical protein